MALQALTSVDLAPLTAALDAIVRRQATSEDDLYRLRQTLFRRDSLSQKQAICLFETHRKMPVSDGLWIEFSIEALAEFFLTRRGNDIFLRAIKEDFLFDVIGEVIPMTDLGHRRLALRLLLRATHVSPRHQRLVFDTVLHHLMHEDRRLLIDLERQAGSVDVLDLHLIRKLVYGAGGQYQGKIDRMTADFLLSLDQARLDFVDPLAWQHLFLKAMSLHLVMNRTHRNGIKGQIDDEAAGWLIEQIEAGRSGRHTTSLIRHLGQNVGSLPDCLNRLVSDR